MSCSDIGWPRVRRWVGPLAICRLTMPLAALAIMAFLATAAAAADPPADAKGKDTAERKIPDPEDVELETTDGLRLAATYYASNVGKEAVPIIMLHGWKGSRADFAPLARLMQDRGHAVIVPDLRGHGSSTQIKSGDATRSIEQATMKKDDFRLMETHDMEAIKKFLMEKNNAGELNIEKLCVVGYEMGAVIAVNWTALDWHWPDLPTVKQGKDVKALVLISPTMNFRGLGINDAINRPLFKTDSDLSVLIVVGDKNSKAMEEAKRINQILGAQRAKPYAEEKEAAEKQMLFFYPLAGTSLQAGETLKDPAILPKVDEVITQFIELRLVNKKFPWTNRKAALGN